MYIIRLDSVRSPSSVSGGVTLFAVPYVDAVAGKAALAQIGRFAITGSFSMVIKLNSNSNHTNISFRHCKLQYFSLSFRMLSS